MTLSVLILVAALWSAPTPLQGGAVVEGVVSNHATGAPVVRAIVELLSDTGAVLSPRITVETDDRGRFVFRGVPPGSFRFAATRNGYVRAEYGQRMMDGPGLPIEIRPGEDVSGIQIPMIATGGIFGRVSDLAGRPVFRAPVDAMIAVTRNGAQTFELVQTAVTDDLGAYRLFGLRPGEYYVRASLPRLMRGEFFFLNPGGTGIRSYANGSVAPEAPEGEPWASATELVVPFYFPGTPESGRALPIAVGGETSVGPVDLTVSTTPARRVRGMVVDAATRQPASATVRARSDENWVVSTPTGAGGVFEITNLTPGPYILEARISGPSSVPLSGSFAVEVFAGWDVDNVLIELGANASVHGRIVVEGGGIADFRFPPDLTLSPGNQRSSPIAADGSFVFQNLPRGNYRLNVAPIQANARRSLPSAYVRSVRFGDSDVLTAGLDLRFPSDHALEVRIAADGGTILGQAIDETGMRTANVTVVLIPGAQENRVRAELYQTAFTDADGRFRFDGIAPGEYKIFTWSAVPQGAWFAPEFLRQYEEMGLRVMVESAGEYDVEARVIAR